MMGEDRGEMSREKEKEDEDEDRSRMLLLPNCHSPFFFYHLTLRHEIELIGKESFIGRLKTEAQSRLTLQSETKSRQWVQKIQRGIDRGLGRKLLFICSM